MATRSFTLSKKNLYSKNMMS